MTKMDGLKKVILHYESDSLKRAAAEFLVSNMENHYEIELQYKDNKSEDLSAFLTTYTGNLTAEMVRDSLGVQMKVSSVRDTDTVNPDLLIKDIDWAFASWHNRLMKKQTYSFQTFLNYVLPYRIGYEKINEWRPYFQKRYTYFLNTFDIKHLSIKQIHQLVVQEQNGTSLYVQNRLKHISKPAINQTLEQILRVRVAFDCEDYAQRTIYAMRSLGIPAAYEKIPLWGKFNYGHAQESVMFENGKFYPVVFGDTAPFTFQIAKMYRRTFQKQPNPRDMILSTGESPMNIPAYFNQNEYIDITDERTLVSDINIKLKNNDYKVLYLSIYNGGEWKPVEWAECKKERTNAFQFRNMGRKILYQLNGFRNGRMQFLDHPFILDENGKISYLSHSGTQRISIRKYDRNMDIEALKTYTLYVWDKPSVGWKKIGTSTSDENAYLQFKNAPKNALYKIEPETTVTDAVRPFTINQDLTQQWW